jgi:ribosome-binding protein aMBF1 (putative translation factor)
MDRPYEEVTPLRIPVEPAFAAAVEADIDAAYDVAFGLGEAVATRRAQLHLSQVELSAATGIPQADISRIERGKGNPTLATVTRLLAALDLHFRIEPDQ